MPPDKPWFYFNGFNSAILEDWSGNPKILAVEAATRRLGCRFAPVSVDYREPERAWERVMEQLTDSTREAVFSGSSMGGWFARITQMLALEVRPALRTAALAFNPAFDLERHQSMLLGPQLNFVTGEHYEWREADGRRLADLESRVDYDSAAPFFVYVDKGDEVIAWEPSARRHATIGRFTAFEGGCHSFDHYVEALRDFEEGFFE